MMCHRSCARIHAALLGFTLAIAGGVRADFLVETYEANSRILSVNPDTGVSTSIGATGVGSLTDLTFGPAGRLYASSLGSLYSVNPTNAATTLIGSFGTTQTMVGLSSAPDGSLYGVDQSGGGFYRINPSSGAATELFSTPFSYTGAVAYAQGNIFYATATESDGSHLIRLDDAASTATDLGLIASGLAIPGMDFDLTGRLVAFATNGDIYAITNYATSGTGTLLSRSGLDPIGGATVIPDVSPPQPIVPEPASGTLLGLGCLLFFGWARRRVT